MPSIAQSAIQQVTVLSLCLLFADLRVGSQGSRVGLVATDPGAKSGGTKGSWEGLVAGSRSHAKAVVLLKLHTTEIALGTSSLLCESKHGRKGHNYHCALYYSVTTL